MMISGLVRRIACLGRLFIGLAAASLPATAATFTFPDQHFSITIPDGWITVSQAPAQAVLAVKSPNGAKQVLVVSQKAPQNGRAMMVPAARLGLKSSMSVSGWTFQPDQEVTIANHPYSLVHGTNGSLGIIAYLGGAGGDMLIVSCTGDSRISANDPELHGIVQSIKFLAGGPPLPVSSAAVFDLGRTLVKQTVIRMLFFLGFVAVAAVIWLLVRKRTKQKPPPLAPRI